MDGLFTNTFDQLGASLKSVLDTFTSSFSTTISGIMEDFTKSFSETFAKMMEGFSSQLATSLGEELDILLNNGMEDLENLLNSGILDEFLTQFNSQLDAYLSKYLIISCIPICLAVVAVIISFLCLSKIKKVALFDKRIEVYSALQFLFEHNKFTKIKDNQVLYSKLEESMSTIATAKFIFDENLTNSINIFANDVYTLVTTQEENENNDILNDKISNFKINTIPDIEVLIKV